MAIVLQTMIANLWNIRIWAPKRNIVEPTVIMAPDERTIPIFAKVYLILVLL